jgi:hypothetical protein
MNQEFEQQSRKAAEQSDEEGQYQYERLLLDVAFAPYQKPK